MRAVDDSDPCLLIWSINAAMSLPLSLLLNNVDVLIFSQQKIKDQPNYNNKFLFP